MFKRTGEGDGSGEGLLFLPTSSLTPYARNPREHTEQQISQIMASIREFGFTAPILIDEDNMVLAGHGRLMAAQNMELEQVPCRKLVGLSQAQKRAYVIADNKMTENSKWDYDLLNIEFDDLQKDGFDLELTGFSSAELETLLGDHKDDNDNLGDPKDDDLWPSINVKVPPHVHEQWIISLSEASGDKDWEKVEWILANSGN